MSEFWKGFILGASFVFFVAAYAARLMVIALL